MNFLDLCRQSVAIDSTPAHGSKEIMLWAAELARQRGLQVTVQTDFLGDIEQLNLIIRPSQSSLIDSTAPATEEFLLQNHLDTVDPGPFQLWKDTDQNPFEAAIKDGKIFGLGVADGKVDFLCKLEALTEFQKKSRSPMGCRLPPVLVATYGAHQGMVGALKMIRRKSFSAKIGLIGEATHLSLATSAPGFALVEIQVPFSPLEIQRRHDQENQESVSTQSQLFNSRLQTLRGPDTHESAIRKMFEYLIQLPENILLIEIEGGSNANTIATNSFIELDLSPITDSILRKLSSIYRFIKALEIEFKAYQDESSSIPTPMLNIGLVRTLEDHVQIIGSCHLPPTISLEVYEGWIDQIKRHCLAVGSSFRLTDYKKPYGLAMSSDLVQGCLDEMKKLAISPLIQGVTATNEASLFSRVGIDCLCFGPGLREGNVHTPCESLNLEEIPKTIAFYKRAIERFCL